MTEYLGYAKYQASIAESGSIRNGARPTMVLIDAAGEVTIAVLRDRVGTFELVIVQEVIASFLGRGRCRD